MSSRGSRLRCLAALADTGDVATAAQSIGVGQASLVRAVDNLEGEVGVPLVERRAGAAVLTPAGEAFLERARLALAAEADAARVARELSRATRATLAVGFIGPPPAATLPGLFERFASAHPEVQVSFQDMTFPSGATSAWLAGVDAAICHRPRSEARVEIVELRREPRALVVRRDHVFGEREEVTVEEVLEETFVGYHGDVQPEWVGFHSLDDHRGGPPSTMTADAVLTSLQMLGVMAAGNAVTTVPSCDAELACRAVPTLAAVPLVDASPASISLVWRSDNSNGALEPLVTAARRLGPGVRDGL
jgi:DNA-binding transcriptional LysR family regulator